MLLIRREQLEAFQLRAVDRFERRLVRHFTKFYPRECRLAGGDSQILKLVHFGRERAAQHGYAAEREVGLYVGLMFMLGSDFDGDPQLPWAATMIDDYDVSEPFERIRQLYRRAVGYLAETAGDEGEYAVESLKRILVYDLQDVPATREHVWEDDLCRLLRHFYPRKYDYQGESLTRELIRLGLRRAGDYGIHDNTGAAVFVTNMFILGSGFDHDFLFPWAGRVLNDRPLDDASDRGAKLYREAIAFLHASLSDS